MKFTSAVSSDSLTTERPKRKHRRKIPTKIPSNTTSYAQTDSSQTSQKYYNKSSCEEADDEYEEQTQTATDSQYTESQTIPPESIRASNTVEASASSSFPPGLQNPIPQSTYINIAPLPIFRGTPNECPVAHLSRFARVCRANNGSSIETMMRIFPVTLDEEAALWYELNIEPYPSLCWEEIKSSFVQTYRRTEFADLRSELMMIRQGDSESVNAFYLRMQWILKKWPDHGIPDVMLKGIFIDGLKDDYQDWIIPQKPSSLLDALKFALSWEQAQSIRAARRKNVAVAGPTVGERERITCGFCDGLHEESTCEIRRKMKDMWVKSKERPSVSPSQNGTDCTSTTPNKGFLRSPSLATSIIRRLGQDEKDGGLLDWRKSPCQCVKHECWKKNGRTHSVISRNHGTD